MVDSLARFADSLARTRHLARRVDGRCAIALGTCSQASTVAALGQASERITAIR